MNLLQVSPNCRNRIPLKFDKYATRQHDHYIRMEQTTERYVKIIDNDAKDDKEDVREKGKDQKPPVGKDC